MIQLSPGEGAAGYKLAVVPVNQPNNEGQPSAEAGEGKAQTKENIVQSHVRLTQSRKGMSQGLHGVRQAARRCTLRSHSPRGKSRMRKRACTDLCGAISDGRP